MSGFALQPRAAVQATPFSPHGAFDFDEMERLGLRPEEVLDFSVNSNPHGPSPRLSEALAHVRLDVYPDREALALRRALVEQLNVSPQGIVVGNGISELVLLVVFAYVQPDHRVLIIGPTYGEYRRAAGLMNAHVEQWNSRAE